MLVREDYKSFRGTYKCYIKCVVFDLDNTLWDGVLGDDSDVFLNLRVVNFIEELDKRGILCSIASKNEFEPAWNKLKEFGLSEYFLYPQINWQPKSRSICQIALDLNISPDTIAFIDDSSFERSEVRVNIPQVLVLSEVHRKILKGREFNPILSKDSHKRRSYYLSEMQRNVVSKEFIDYDEFLRSCDIKLEFLDVDYDRCQELVDRINQYTTGTKEVTTGKCFRIEDKFGDYGIVGYFRLDNGILMDYNMSCRVAGKRVEETVFYLLGYPVIRFSDTNRNKPMRDKLISIGYKLPDGTINKLLPDPNVINVLNPDGIY